MSPATEIQSNIVTIGDQQAVTAFIPGFDLVTATDAHPNFRAIVGALAAYAEGEDVDYRQLHDLFSAEQAVKERFEQLSERVSVENGTVLFDGDPVDNSVTQQIVRFLDEDEDFEPLVYFMENIGQNPSPKSVEQLYDWLSQGDGVTLTPDGLIVGYKGVNKDADGALVSGYSGSAIVTRFDGEPERINGHIPNEVGFTVEMPRSSVVDDPDNACSTGLHVGTFSYAQGYARGAMLKVYVDPRDVVSVPRDAHGEKIRVCRYFVAEVIDKPVEGALDAAHEDGDDCGSLYV